MSEQEKKWEDGCENDFAQPVKKDADFYAEDSPESFSEGESDFGFVPEEVQEEVEVEDFEDEVEDFDEIEVEQAEVEESDLMEVEFRRFLPAVASLDYHLIYGKAEAVSVEEPTPAAIETEPEPEPEPESQSESEKMEVLGPEPKKRGGNELSQAHALGQGGSKWAFWKRPSKRDRQLQQMSDGYLEMVDLVRAIRSQLDSQNENNIILRDSLAHLPDAMKGLDSFSKSQHTVGAALQEIHGQMQRYSSKDEKLADSMNGFNDTLRGMDDTSKESLKTFDRVQERLRDSDLRMENLFRNVQSSEEKVSDTMVRLQRNMAIMQSLFLICLMIVIGVLVFTVMRGSDDKPEPKIEVTLPSQSPASPSPPQPTEQ